MLRVETTAAKHHTARYGDVPDIDAVATHDPDSGALTVFVVNRGLTDEAAVGIDTRAFGQLRLIGATQLSNPDPYLKVAAETAGAVSPVANGNTSWNGSTLAVVTPAVSWNVVRFQVG